MYAHLGQPNKEICTKVAKQLIQKYSFMKDIGANVTGYVSCAGHSANYMYKLPFLALYFICFSGLYRAHGKKKLIERVHNVAKAGQKRSSEQSSAVNHGRPKHEDHILARYPPMQYVADDVDEDKLKALQVELERVKPRRDIIVLLYKDTFTERRQFVLSAQVISVDDLIKRYKGFTLPYVVR